MDITSLTEKRLYMSSLTVYHLEQNISYVLEELRMQLRKVTENS
ncbi:hypothetical protein FB443_10889 [Vibrio crassostreae]|nr:hypothetical protein EDB72_4275 [Vibrio crassostreae]ROR77282.1 hypothetical protein EDB66_4073 [Vibrio crassostreae]RPE99246.1 hypothetical protein EDB17_4256 [Vibrio crassostreae]TQL30962.1 hypothetical protein FB443_10889 [Vibrio crassostreae]